MMTWRHRLFLALAAGDRYRTGTDRVTSRRKGSRSEESTRKYAPKVLMATVFESRRKILFVDDDPDFLDLIRASAAASGNHWDILIANTTAKALALCKEHTIHLAVIDVSMPVIDGSQFLTLLNRQYPAMLKVMLTATPSDSARSESLGNGAELFLEKPRNQAEQEILFVTLNEVMTRRPEEGFRGVLQQVGLGDVIQMACLGGNTTVFEVTSRHKHGEIYIRNGAIIHVTFGEEVGQRALNRLLRLKRGEFHARDFMEPPEHSISAPWEFLLMEGAQFRDETMHLGEGDTLFMKNLSVRTSSAAEAENPADEDSVQNEGDKTEPDLASLEADALENAIPLKPTEFIADDRPRPADDAEPENADSNL